MRIFSANGMSGATSSVAARRVGGGGFSLPQTGSDTAPARTGGIRNAAGIDALIAMQGVDDPTERRRRSVARGRQALDVLEELKLGVLVGTLDQSVVLRLKTVAAGLKDASGDRNLDAVIAQIDLRVEVELAKLGSQTSA